MTIHAEIQSADVVPFPGERFTVEGIAGFKAETVPTFDVPAFEVPADEPAVEESPLPVTDDFYSVDLADYEIVTGPPKPMTIRATAVVERAALAVAVNAAVRVAMKRSTIPILSNVLLRATESGLVVTGTDLDREIACPVFGEVEGDFAATVPAHMLAKVLKEAKACDTVTITAEHVQHWGNWDGPDESSSWRVTGDGKAVLDFSGLKVTLNTLPAADFPAMQAEEWARTFTLPTADLIRGLKRTEFAISTEETRFCLNGVYVHHIPANGVARYNGDNGTLRFVATDGHRMAIADVAAPAGAEGMAGVIIPRQTVAELIHATRGKTPPESIKVAMGSAVRFTVGDVVITSKLVDGTFPDYGRVLPSGNDKRMATNTDILDKAIAQVMVISSERGRAVRFSLEDSRLRLLVSNPDTGNAETDVECEYASDPMDIGFNAVYLRDILAQVESDGVEFMLADPGSPTLIRGTGDADAGIQYVLMPCRV